MIPELAGKDTLKTPLLLPTALVIGVQFTGGVKFVAPYKFQVLAQPDQEKFTALAPAYVADSLGRDAEVNGPMA